MEDRTPNGEKQSWGDEIKEQGANVGDEIGEGLSATGGIIKESGDSLQEESEEEIAEHGDADDQDKIQ